MREGLSLAVGHSGLSVSVLRVVLFFHGYGGDEGLMPPFRCFCGVFCFHLLSLCSAPGFGWGVVLYCTYEYVEDDELGRLLLLFVEVSVGVNVCKRRRWRSYLGVFRLLMVIC